MPVPKTLKKVKDDFVAEVTEMLKRGEEVAIPGIGTLSVIDKAERPGRNPFTGEAITIPAKKAPKFVPAGALKAAVNG